MSTGKKLLSFLNGLTEDYRLDSQTIDDWRTEHIFGKDKIENNITGEKTTAKFALVFDDGYLSAIFDLYRSEITTWATQNGLFMEQYNSWNAMFYRGHH